MSVFIRNCRKFNEPIESAVSHEVGEALVDPACNLYAWDPKLQVFHSWEPWDPAEGIFIDVDGFQFQNFVHPGWYEATAIGEHHYRFDEAWGMNGPFKIAQHGYSQILDIKTGKWNYVFGSDEKKAQFEQEDHRGHRTELRQQAFTATSET